jgi:hypothetical protein
MKRFIGVFIVILFSFISIKGIFAQPIKGKKFEFSTSASMWNIKDEGETETLINLPIRIGFFIYKGIEIEPELILTIPEDSGETGYIILANVSYNFKASETLIPFILAGAGYGNGPRYFDAVWDFDMGVTVFNFGAGIKYVVGNTAAIRIEYRFTKYSGEETHTNFWGTWTDKLDRTENNVLVGISIFF